ncbi:hypothetical protein U732_10 [Clostridium argentinense CDC 2741]|uniref:Phosphoadenosine phosphosulfate reductase family protein n=2 Tax=Clostridium argentinense TaxID=29341 RepID=A0A0C1U9S7_9CLOT|nr:hypothetical protein [Clostridium argentinense]ARC83129.1 hypothetical protein RSJ17_00315 [Clostridium argentinense]KIE44365.1 hypothetical protein U732_10 [Clostridium argentinense CDC 2741]NFF41317.1 hypothetical protein [Clostridium argentinense]NFP51788.1 hypothetical protein [Clostridium argentinense]NFP74242.1 hypothetical protein [Clostridium argentinense]
MEKYIVCFSGGHSSALVAIEAVRRYGRKNVILLNHNISPEVEELDIKRFKQEVADYLGLKITYANMEGWEHKTPLRVCRELGGFKFNNGPVLCTYKLKTEPFHEWLKDHYPVTKGDVREDIVLLYGFDKGETNRIQRRIGVMISKGYKTDFPLAFWDRTIENTEEIGIKRPNVYELFRHANCIGCLKAGKQQWYIIYCLYPNLWKEAKETEEEIGYSILKDNFLEELEPKFEQMKCKGIVPGERMTPQKFWAEVKKALPMEGQLSFLPCECAL